MGKLYALLALSLFFLVACSSPPPTIEENSTSSSSPLLTELQNISVVEPQPLPLEDTYLKKLEAHGFGLFNYSILNAATCLDAYEEHRLHVLDLEEDIQDAESDLADEKQDLIPLQEKIALAEQIGDDKEVQHLKKKLEQEEDEAREAENVFDDLDGLYKKSVIIRDEIAHLCLSFGIKV